MEHQTEPQIALQVPVPYMFVQKLPRCPNPDCPDPVHPLAREGQYNPVICPGCGGPAAEPGEQQEVDPVLPEGLTFDPDAMQVYIGKPRDED